MHPLYGAIPMPNVPVRVTRDALVALGTLMRLLATELCVPQDFYSPIRIFVERSW